MWSGPGLGPGVFKGWVMPAEGAAGSTISPVDDSEGRDTEVLWEGLSSGQGQCPGSFLRSPGGVCR